MTDWLPELFEYDTTMDLQQYINAVYEIFKENFIYNDVYYDGEKIAIKYTPIRDGKEASFYHLTTSGNNEDEREVDLTRCARLSWIKPIIETKHTDIKIWSNFQKRQTSIKLYYEKANYLVILRERNGYRILWTAYPVIYKHTRKKLLQEYQDFIDQKNNK